MYIKPWSLTKKEISSQMSATNKKQKPTAKEVSKYAVYHIQPNNCTVHLTFSNWLKVYEPKYHANKPTPE